MGQICVRWHGRLYKIYWLVRKQDTGTSCLVLNTCDACLTCACLSLPGVDHGGLSSFFMFLLCLHFKKQVWPLHLERKHWMLKKLIPIGRVDTEDDKLPRMAATFYGLRTSLVCGTKQWFPSCGQTPGESVKCRSPSNFPLQIGKDPDSGKDWRQKEKRVPGNEMVGWHLIQWTWTWASSGRWWGIARPGVAVVHGVAKSWTRVSDWKTTLLLCLWNGYPLNQFIRFLCFWLKWSQLSAIALWEFSDVTEQGLGLWKQY